MGDVEDVKPRKQLTEGQKAYQERRHTEKKVQAREIELKVIWTVNAIRDNVTLFGHSPKLVKLVSEHFGCCRQTSEKVVARAYKKIKAEIAEFKPNIADFLIEVHLQTIWKGFKEDGRLITPAATALAKLSGADAADRVHVTGSTNTKITLDEQNLVRALRLTNAQRLAQIDQLRVELGLDPDPMRQSHANHSPTRATESHVQEEFAPYPESPTEDEVMEHDEDQDEELSFTPLTTEEDDDEDE